MEEYISEIRKKYPLHTVESALLKLKDLNVLVLGDTILDHYVFVTVKGRAVKDPILSTGYYAEEMYAGGILSVAQHISSFVKSVDLVTLVGDNDDNKVDFIRSKLSKNVNAHFFEKPNSPTTIKKRYVDRNRNNKLFKIEYMNDEPLSSEVTQQIMKWLERTIESYDLVVVGDFGHGFINHALRQFIETKAKHLSINVQSNSANFGFNLVNLYNQSHLLTLNEEELRHPLMMRYHSIADTMRAFNQKYNFNRFMVTLGKHGCTYFHEGELHEAPALIGDVKDTVGAGDALFSIASLLNVVNCDPELMLFLASCAGGIKTQYLGNKYCVTHKSLLDFVKTIYGFEKLNSVPVVRK